MRRNSTALSGIPSGDCGAIRSENKITNIIRNSHDAMTCTDVQGRQPTNAVEVRTGI
ncbi:hypothetical protein DPMN_137462 [Dreissena polymorpha]|uniref:Uncharacterized protein n=1 Tax=Dreissena polymorpha TaxID=45954 RepID=A0A9D4G4S2_DREPO|nr:hypothetical protein DPMN_137462 [Dreissena polymorpha]